MLEFDGCDADAESGESDTAGELRLEAVRPLAMATLVDLFDERHPAAVRLATVRMVLTPLRDLDSRPPKPEPMNEPAQAEAQARVDKIIQTIMDHRRLCPRCEAVLDPDDFASAPYDISTDTYDFGDRRYVPDPDESVPGIHDPRGGTSQ